MSFVCHSLHPHSSSLTLSERPCVWGFWRAVCRSHPGKRKNGPAWLPVPRHCPLTHFMLISHALWLQNRNLPVDFDEIFEATKVRPPRSCEVRVALVILTRSVQPHSPHCSALGPAFSDVQRLLGGPAGRVKSRSMCIRVCVCERERERNSVCWRGTDTPSFHSANVFQCPDVSQAFW